MLKDSTRYRLLLLLSIMGFAIAGLAGLSEHVAWLESFCGSISSGCSDAVKFTLLGLPLWIWGMGFYAVLLAVVLRLRRWMGWLVAGAVGVELALVYLMIVAKMACVFCLGNFLVVLLLVILSFEQERFWQTVAVSLLLFVIAGFALTRENELLASTAVRQDQPDIVARVAGEVISREDLETPLATSIYDLELDIYRMKKQRLDQMISDKVLQKEAEERGVTVQELIDHVVLAAGVVVSDEDVNRYIEENRPRLAGWKGSDEELRSRISAYLKQQKTFQKVMEYSKSLAGKYGVMVYLTEPSPPNPKVNIEGNAVMGPPDAPVTVVEFSDYQCPACRQAHDTVRKIRWLFQGRLKWVFKDYPLKKHKDAELAAEAARCAGDQDKFWEYQDLLYGADGELTADRMEAFAEQLGLDKDKFKQCLESRKYQAKVEQDIEDAKKVGVDRTPTFLINGRLTIGAPPFEQFKQAIDNELAKSARKDPSGPAQ